jgi:hypothetical protein
VTRLGGKPRGQRAPGPGVRESEHLESGVRDRVSQLASRPRKAPSGEVGTESTGVRLGSAERWWRVPRACGPSDRTVGAAGLGGPFHLIHGRGLFHAIHYSWRFRLCRGRHADTRLPAPPRPQRYASAEPQRCSFALPSRHLTSQQPRRGQPHTRVSPPVTSTKPGRAAAVPPFNKLPRSGALFRCRYGNDAGLPAVVKRR